MKKTTLGLLIFLIVSGCTLNIHPWSEGFLDWLTDLNEVHEGYRSPTISYQPYEEFQRGESINYDDLLSYFYNGETQAEWVTIEEACEDVEFYFQMLRQYYGGYLYFGGDERFTQAKEECLDYLNAMEGTIESSRLIRILLSVTSFVKDNHFTIGDKRSNAASKYFSNETLSFYKEEGKVYDMLGRQVVRVDQDEEVERYFYLSLDENAELCWHFGLFLKQYPHPVYTLYYDDGSQAQISVDYVYLKNMPEYNEQLIDDVPVVRIGTMFSEYVDEREKAETFLKSSRWVKRYSAAILDLRSNHGGNGLLPLKWIEEFTGETVTTNGAGIMIYDGDADYNDTLTGENSQKMSDIKHYFGLQELQQGIYQKQTESDVFAENDTVLFVLMNGYSASAAEYMIDALHNVENVVFVGTPSAGCLQSDNGNVLLLPHSKIKVAFGNSWSEYDPDYYQEFEGFKPDIWVNSANLEELVVRFIKQNQKDY